MPQIFGVAKKILNILNFGNIFTGNMKSHLKASVSQADVQRFEPHLG